MKKTFVLLFFLIAAAGTLFAQSKKKKNPFEMVHVDDSVRNKLCRYLLPERKDSINPGIYIYHLLGKDKASNYKFVEGLYSFRLMGPHFPVYYFLYTEKEGVEIITAYDLEGLLTQVVSCFKRNLDRFEETERIAYIEKMIHNLDDRPNSYGAEILVKPKTKGRIDNNQ